MNTDDELDLRQYLQALRRHVKLLVAVVAVCAIAAGAFSLTQPKVYMATAKVVISSGQDALTSTSFLSDPNAFNNQMGTQVQLVKSPDVVKVATGSLGVESSGVIGVDASGVTNTRILAISVRSKSPRVARDGANAYAAAYLQTQADDSVSQVLAIGDSVQKKQQELQTQLDQLDSQINANPGLPNVDSLRAQRAAIAGQVTQLQQRYNQVQANATVRDSVAQLLASAQLPTSPVSPKPVRNVGLAVVLGLLLGVGVVLLIERFDDRVHVSDDLARYVPGLTLLGSIPKVDSWKDVSEAKAVTLLDPQSVAAESYRRLRTSIEFAGLGRDLKVIEITSSIAGEGKSTTAANLATAFAWTGKKVVVVAADLRRPRLAEFFHINDERGLTSCLLADDDAWSMVQKVEVHPGGTVHVLPTGPLPPNPAEVLASASIGQVIESLKKSADYVIIDSPPLMPVSDPLVLSQYVDGILLVAGAEKVRGRQLVRAVDTIVQSTATPVIGVVLNGASPEPGYGYRYDRYYTDVTDVTEQPELAEPEVREASK